MFPEMRPFVLGAAMSLGAGCLLCACLNDMCLDWSRRHHEEHSATVAAILCYLALRFAVAVRWLEAFAAIIFAAGPNPQDHR
jgi:hypothetical protein